MEATAYTDNGKVYSVNEKSEKTLMIKDDRPYTNIYNLTIWPAGFLLYLRVRQLYGLIIYLQIKMVQ